MKFVAGKKRLLVSASEGTFLWDIEKGERIWERRLYDRLSVLGQISSASADETRLAALLSSGDIGILDVADGNMSCELKGRAGALTDLSLSPSDPIAAGAYTDGVVAIWDLRTGDIWDLQVPISHERRVCFSPDGNHLLTCGIRGRSGNSFEMWSISGRRPDHSLAK